MESAATFYHYGVSSWEIEIIYDTLNRSFEVEEKQLQPDDPQLDDAQLARAVDQLTSVGSAWDARLQRIKQIAEAIQRGHDGRDIEPTEGER